MKCVKAVIIRKRSATPQTTRSSTLLQTALILLGRGANGDQVELGRAPAGGNKLGVYRDGTIAITAGFNNNTASNEVRVYRISDNKLSHVLTDDHDVYEVFAVGDRMFLDAVSGFWELVNV